MLSQAPPARASMPTLIEKQRSRLHWARIHDHHLVPRTMILLNVSFSAPPPLMMLSPYVCMQTCRGEGFWSIMTIPRRQLNKRKRWYDSPYATHSWSYSFSLLMHAPHASSKN